MQDVWLVYLPKATFRPYTERFKVFTSREAAYEHARSEGFETMFIPADDRVGVLNTYACGDVWVDVVRLQVS